MDQADATILTELRRTVRAERDVLSSLEGALDDAYVTAVRWLLTCAGKVVVTGVGKSGIVGRKMAATMTSTGTLAVFMHPGDASHGDLGLVGPNDVVILISKSGASDELLAILPNLRQASRRLICITAEADSALGQAADIVLRTPIEEEACPLKLAPTSSSTAAMVVGDALAMAVMACRNFQPHDYARFHPAGQLGKRLIMRVTDVMRDAEETMVRVDAPIVECLGKVSSGRCGAAGVVDAEGRLLGIVSDYDIRKNLEARRNILQLGIADLMNKHPRVAYSDQMAAEVLDIMRRKRPVSQIPVVDRETYRGVGMVHLHDLLDRGL